MVILVERAQNMSKSFQTCGAVQNFVADDVSVIEHFGVEVEVEFFWRAQGIVRWQCLMELSAAATLLACQRLWS